MKLKDIINESLLRKQSSEFFQINKDRREKGLTPWSKKKYLEWKKSFKKADKRLLKKGLIKKIN